MGNTKRRSPEERQEIASLVAGLLERIKKYEVTSYELNKVVDMTIPGLNKIIKGSTKYPDLKLLKEIDSYITRHYETPQDQLVKEPESKYEMGIPELMKKLSAIEDKIDKCALKQDIIFEILRNGKAAELSYITKMAAEKINSSPE